VFWVLSWGSRAVINVGTSTPSWAHSGAYRYYRYRGRYHRYYNPAGRR
jgi:hypothetical protein